jgi:hypothetical protein
VLFYKLIERDSPVLDIFPGQQIYMRALRIINLRFENCAAFASKMRFLPAAVVHLTEREGRDTAMGFFNHHFIPLLPSVRLLQMSIEYYLEGVSVKLAIGRYEVRYTSNDTSYIALEALVCDLAPEIRDVISSVCIMGGSDSAEESAITTNALSKLFPKANCMYM